MQSELAPRSLRGAEDEPDDDDAAASASAEDSEGPFIRRVFSGRRRRRTVTDLPGAARRRPSFRRDVGHAASETYLITRLTLILLRYLGVGYRWITKCLALGCYAMLLMPGFLQVAYYYFFSSQVRRSVVYGEQPRNRLDLYLPIDNVGSKPVVAFVTGGAWIIGYKAWGALLGKRLSERGVIVACIDYRNFPQGTISDMVNDVSKGISFVCNNAASFGGDPDRIYLIGQSAGAHIATCTLFDQVIKECGEGESTGWSACQIKTYFGLSGGYNVLNLVEHFHSRGLYRSLFLSIMEGEQSLRRFSPELLVQDLSVRHAVSLLPPIILYHGTGDYSIPSAASKDFAAALESVGAQVKLLLYEGKTHTDLFLQNTTSDSAILNLSDLAASLPNRATLSKGGILAAAMDHDQTSPLLTYEVPNPDEWFFNNTGKFACHNFVEQWTYTPWRMSEEDQYEILIVECAKKTNMRF